MNLVRWVLFSLILEIVGCTTQTLMLEPTRPLNIKEPVYFDANTQVTGFDLVAIYDPKRPGKLGPPTIELSRLGPSSSNPPAIAQASKSKLARIIREIPNNLPHRAAFLISSKGDVIEVVFVGSRDEFNERLFAAELRKLKFAPATKDGVPIAIVESFDLWALAGKNPLTQPTQSSQPTGG
jgi:hypothetical protein